ncbi:MAG: MarR family transcriptional regulator [Chloroflexi bacterium]|jgi:DNA-binding MarR family transcriptional regulator|nr:MarR family transcriptional regulator [Chloroflexota bacterium]
MRRWADDETIDMLLAQVGHLQHALVHRGIESFGLYRGQPRVLRLLWEEDGLTHSDLASRMRVQPATVSKMVQRMERSGFVERRRDPSDERVSRVYLTGRGRAVQGQVEDWFRDFQASYTTGLDEHDLAALRRLLMHIRDRLVESYMPAAQGSEPPVPLAPTTDSVDRSSLNA